MNQHTYSFFGQASAMIFDSALKSDSFVFLKFIKKKNEDLWEKPSKGEGKTIRLSLEETLSLLNVLRRKSPEYKTYHKYKNDSTSISFKWDNMDFWININGSGTGYNKKLSSEQVELFIMLLEHIMKEKIEFSTISKYDSEFNEKERNDDFLSKRQEYLESKPSNQVLQNSNYHLDLNFKHKNQDPQKLTHPDQEITMKSAPTKDKTIIQTRISGCTEKALLLLMQDNQEMWLPKSTIHCDYNENDKESLQPLTIDDWILKKNKII